MMRIIMTLISKKPAPNVFEVIGSIPKDLPKNFPLLFQLDPKTLQDLCNRNFQMKLDALAASAKKECDKTQKVGEDKIGV